MAIRILPPSLPLTLRALVRAAALPLLLDGCLGGATRAPEQSTVLQEFGQPDLTNRRVRLAADNTVEAYLGVIEVAADSIMRATPSATVRRNALAWKANSVPAVLRAMHHTDPLVSFIDGWALVQQMLDYLETGRGSALFGDEQGIAIDAMALLAEETGASVERELGPETYASYGDFVDEWSRRYPLDNDLVHRRSVASQVVEQLAAEGTGGLSAVGSLQEMAVDAQQMAQSYLAYLPKILMWQAEEMVSSMLDSARITPVLEGVDQMAVTRAATSALEDVPALLDRERAAALDEIDALTEARMLELVTVARSERAILLAELERIAAAERAASLAGAEAALLRAIEQGRVEAIAVIDHVLWRLAVAAAILVALVAVGLGLVVSALRRRGSA